MVRPNHPFFGSNGIYGTVETHVNRKIIPEITVVGQLEKSRSCDARQKSTPSGMASSANGALLYQLPKIHTRRIASSANGALLYQPRAKPWVQIEPQPESPAYS
jgi:hypothetical protein